jgi:hypothetical protein
MSIEKKVPTDAQKAAEFLGIRVLTPLEEEAVGAGMMAEEESHDHDHGTDHDHCLV